MGINLQKVHTMMHLSVALPIICCPGSVCNNMYDSSRKKDVYKSAKQMLRDMEAYSEFKRYM